MRHAWKLTCWFQREDPTAPYPYNPHALRCVVDKLLCHYSDLSVSLPPFLSVSLSLSLSLLSLSLSLSPPPPPSFSLSLSIPLSFSLSPLPLSPPPLSLSLLSFSLSLFLSLFLSRSLPSIFQALALSPFSQSSAVCISPGLVLQFASFASDRQALQVWPGQRGRVSLSLLFWSPVWKERRNRLEWGLNPWWHEGL